MTLITIVIVNMYVPLILIGVLIIITVLLILADKALGGNVEKTLIINDKTKIPVKGDNTVLNTLSEHKIFIPSACGGKATCGFCKFKLVEGGGPVKPTEEPYLSPKEKEEGIRLSCQVKVQNNMRISIPESMMDAKEYTTRVVNIRDLTYDIKLVELKLINPSMMEFKPGQYAQLKVPGIEVIRAYSIASNPKATDRIEFIIRMVTKGKATTFVHKALEQGDKVIVTGPYGDFYLQEGSLRDMVCIAGGSGKAPIRSILNYMKDRGMPRKVQYFFGARTVKDLYFSEEFNEMSEAFKNFTYIPALSSSPPEENWTGEKGLITEVVDRLTGNLEETEAYLCGSPGMIDACIKILKAHGVKEERIYYDKFS